MPLFFATVRTPPDKRDHTALEAALDKSSTVWQIVENHLDEKKYLAGDEFSIGDIPLGVWAHRWFNLPVQRPEQKRIRDWYERLTERKPYQTHIMIPIT